MDVHIGRQPVFDARGRIVGYELLFRDADVEYADFSSGTAATAQVLLASFLDIGLERLVGRGTAFLKLPRAYVVNELSLPAAPGRLVLEVLPEDIADDEQVLAGVRRLRAAGHLVALQDTDGTLHSWPVLREVDLVKVDALRQGDALETTLRRCHAAGLRVVAEKVETAEALATCRELGVAYLQGHLLSRPEVLRGRALSAGQTACLQLVRALDRPDVSVADLARLVGSDPGLSFRLLRAANAVSVGARRHVTGLSEALLMLGFAHTRRWALLMLVTGLPTEAAAGVEAALLRAAMCERLAALVDDAEPDEGYMVGLLSSLAELLRLPVGELLQELPLAPSTREALLTQDGPVGEVLRCVLAYEAGEPTVPKDSHLAADAPRVAFLQAVEAVTRDQAMLGADA